MKEDITHSLVKSSIRKSLRISGFDYSLPGAYFVTICLREKRCLLGEVREQKMILNEIGYVVRDSWLWLAVQYSEFLQLDSWVIMPNHVHGILVVTTTRPVSKPLGNLVCAFKNVARSRLCTEGLLASYEQLWQRGYYEHVVRSEQELFRIRQYILDNPAQWEVDRENPSSKL